MTSPFTARFAQSTLAACLAQFPRKCSGCRRDIGSFAQFLRETKKVGAPKVDAYDDDDDVIGMLCFANCTCGSTLALRYEDVVVHRAFNAALRHEARAGGVAEQALTVELVKSVDALALGGAAAPLPSSLSLDASLLEVGAAMVAIVARNKMVIPPVPAVAFKVEQLARATNSSVANVTETLSADSALAAGVMQVANTAHYARGTAVTSLPVAVGRIGMKEVGRIAIAAGVGATAAKTGPLSTLRQQLWNRSLLMAHVARALAVKRGLDGDEGFLCGLLQPMGAIVGTLSLEVYLATTPSFTPRPMHWWMRVLEMFRVELGALTAARWKLPPVLGQAIGAPFNVDQDDAPTPTMIGIVNAAAEVVDFVEWTTVLTAEAFTLCTKVAPDERQLLADAVPAALEFVAAFESGLQRPPAKSLVSPPTLVVTPSAPDVHVVSSTSRTRYRVVAFAPAGLVIEGPTSLAENLVAHLDVDGASPPLTFWATARSNVAIEGGWRVTLTPFAVSQAIFDRWNALIAPPAAPTG